MRADVAVGWKKFEIADLRLVVSCVTQSYKKNPGAGREDDAVLALSLGGRRGSFLFE